MKRNRKIPCLTNQLKSRINPFVGRVAFGTCCQINCSLSQRNSSFRPTDFHHGIESCVCKQQCIRISKTDIFGSRNDKTARNKSRIFPTLYHTCKPVQCPIRIASSNRLNKSRNNVVVHFSIFVISQRILLQTLHNLIICYHNRHVIVCFYYQLQYIQQFSGISSRIT